MNPRKAAARALANVALVKYFGKRDVNLNLPAAGSLSITLEPLETKTLINFNERYETDYVYFDGEPATPAFTKRVASFLDLIRRLSDSCLFARVDTTNYFPTAAGLASSASGFAALSLAASHALGLNLDEKGLSALARRGSGSAARSVPGGLVVWDEGGKRDGSDSIARSITSPKDWDLRMIVGVTDRAQKQVGSTVAMELARSTSPFYSEWVANTRKDLGEAVGAVSHRDLEKLGEIAERSALTMHALALSSRPGTIFWRGATVEALHLTREMRRGGIPCWFTCDAGPQPKILCDSTSEERIASALLSVPGIAEIILCRPGEGAKLLELETSA